MAFNSDIKGMDFERVACASKLNDIFVPGTPIDSTYVDLLFGAQSWRNGIFDVRSLNTLNSTLPKASQGDLQAIQALFAYVVSRQGLPVTSVLRQNTVRSGDQGNVSDAQDFMTNIATNTKLYTHKKAASFNPSQQVDVTQTVLFQSAQLVKVGVLKGTFDLSDQQATYLVAADAFTAAGVIGFNNLTISTRQTFVMSYNAP